MKNISIIANQAPTTRQFLRTPIFDFLKDRADNLITVYTPARRLRGEFKGTNIRFRGSRFLRGLKDSDIILIPEWESDTSRDILKKAAEWKVPTLFVQGSTGAPSTGYKTDIYPTRICAWGQMSRDVYVERGIDPSRVVLTGEPRFDWYYRIDKKRLFQTDKKILLFTTQALWQSPEHYVNAKETITRQLDIMHRICRRLDVQLVIKVCPSELDHTDLYRRDGAIIVKDTGVSPKNYVKWYCNTGYDPRVSDLKRLGEILSSCDVATTIWSATGLEAMILGKPAIFFDSAGYYKVNKIHRAFIESCSFALATNEEEFSRLLENYLKDPNADLKKRKEVIFNLSYKQDGQASRRVVNVIEDLLNQKR